MNYNKATPVEVRLKQAKRKRYLIIFVLLLVGLYYFVGVRTYTPKFRDVTDHFKYGSIGSEEANGLPYWIFKSLPFLFPDVFDGKGYEKFGFLYEADADLPIGFSTRTITGVKRVWLNCAGCHTASYVDPAGETHFIVGTGANELRLMEFIQAMRTVARDNRFSSERADDVIAAMQQAGADLGFFERAFYRYYIIGAVKKGLINIGEQLAFLDRDDLNAWGAGRVDTFNPYKSIQFNFPMDKEHLSADQLNGPADYPSLWMQTPRDELHLHWDGNNSSVAERNLSAALGAGVTPVSVDRKSLRRIEEWIQEFPAPAYPLLDKVDQTIAARGEKIYGRHCALCHGTKKLGQKDYDYSTLRYPKLGTVVELSEIGTDPARFNSYTENFSATQNSLYAGYPWRFTHFKKTEGYSNQPLDGIWARAPYLHNGSVPTLRDLLDSSAERPKYFYRGNKTFDWNKVGYESYPANDKASLKNVPGLFLYDTTMLGNLNKGHEYGTHLSAADKDAIVEFMKTF